MWLSTLVLAGIWCALTRELTPANVLVGVVLGGVLVRITRPGGVALRAAARRDHRWSSVLRRACGALSLSGFVLFELLLSNARMAVLVLGPRRRLRPAIIGVPVQVESEAELALLSDLITLTPGTLTVDASLERGTVWVHCMGVRDVEAVRRGIQAGFARRVRRVFA